MRQSGHTYNCGRIVYLQEEDPSIKIGQDWTSLAAEVSEGHYHGEIIDNERYNLVNVDTEVGLVQGCGRPFKKTSE